jgi:predicted unusual protein kinase regulating ubiquinone biosynthesis (AarF/ABC1/UbiB family)
LLSPVDRLIRIRKTLRLSQRQLAKEFQVSTGAVGSWEVGKRDIPGPVLKLIEIYESELKINPESFHAPEAVEHLMHAFRKTARITDGDILSSLHGAIHGFVSEFKGKTQFARRLEIMALRPLIKALGEARGLPMKVAQAASLLDPRIPIEIREVFEFLQCSGRALPRRTVEKIFLEEFDRPSHELFAKFSIKPIATASIGQVHRARLHDGTWVAVKIQSPEVQAGIAKNFTCNQFVDQLSLFIGSQAMEMQSLIQDLRQTALKECDYEQEAETQELFRILFLNDPTIVVPKVYFSHSRKRVLTMDWGNGLSWRDFRRTANQVERDTAAKIISRFFATAAFTRGLIHSDPHPGNYLFDNGGIVFIDFGRVRKLPQETRSDLQTLHTLLINNDRADAQNFVQNNSLFKVSQNFNFDRFWEIATEISLHLRKPGEVAFTQESFVRHRSLLRDLADTGTITVSPDFFWSVLFTYTLMLSGRADLGATGNWRQILSDGGVV